MENKEIYEKHKKRLDKYNINESMKNNIKALIEGVEGLGLGINVHKLYERNNGGVKIEIANDSYYLVVIANNRFFKMGYDNVYYYDEFECIFKCGSSNIDEAVDYVKKYFTEESY